MNPNLAEVLSPRTLYLNKYQAALVRSKMSELQEESGADDRMLKYFFDDKQDHAVSSEHRRLHNIVEAHKQLVPRLRGKAMVDDNRMLQLSQQMVLQATDL